MTTEAMLWSEVDIIGSTLFDIFDLVYHIY